VSEHEQATSSPHHAEPDRLDLGPRSWPLFTTSFMAGMAGLGLAMVLGFARGDGFRRFFFAYLTSYAFVLSIAIGALLFVLVQHLFRAGWSVSVRRVAEAMAGTLPMLAVLAAPIVLSVVLQRGELYPWARHHGTAGHEAPAQHAPEHSPAEGKDNPRAKAIARFDTHDRGDDELTRAKTGWLNIPFFLLRLVIYFGILSGVGYWYWKQSTRQDHTDSIEPSIRMQSLSAPAMLATFLAMTFASFDLLMSLDPHWYSTMYGIYFFSGAAVGAVASLILVFVVLQKLGFLVHSVSKEHYHDLGKLLFAFTFFWGYIAFSQYMLVWYGAIPEEIGWYIRRGCSTMVPNAWSKVIIALLFGHLLIPFAGLLSRHAKRNRTVLAFWAAWLLIFHWIDMFWLVMPESTYGIAGVHGHDVPFGPIEIFTTLGVSGLFFAAFVRMLARAHLRPTNDPRLGEALAFHNV
jgi:hypothetical protein